MARYEIVSSRTDDRHRVWDRDEDRVVFVSEPGDLAAAEKAMSSRLRKVRQVAPAPAVLELTAQRTGTRKGHDVDSPHIVENTDGFRVWWPAKRIFVGRAHGGGAMATLVEAQGRLRELLEQEAGLAPPVHQQLGMFAEPPSRPAVPAGGLFKMNGRGEVRPARGRAKGNPMGDHLGVAAQPRHARPHYPEADSFGGYFPDDYQGPGGYTPHVQQPQAPGRRSAKRNGAAKPKKPAGRSATARAAQATVARFVAPRGR